MPRSPRPLILAVTCALITLVPAGLLPAAATAASPTAVTAPTAASPTAATAASPAKLTLVFPLAAHTAGLAAFATAVSTPGNPLYRHYRSIAWLARRFGARPAAEQRVVAYLRAVGASGVRVDRTGLFIDARLAATRAEALFGDASERRAARVGAVRSATPASVRIPAALKGVVTGVVGLDIAAKVAAPALDTGSGYQGPDPQTDPPTINTDGGTPSGCAAGEDVDGFTPNEYLTAYNYGTLQSAGILGQGERVALIEIDGFKRADIDTFAKCFGLAVPKIVAFRTDDEVTNAGLAPGGESTLDLEVLDAAAPELRQIDVYESSGDIGDTLESLTAPLQNSGYKPEVISASLGLCEAQTKQGIGAAGLSKVEAALEEAAASGISVLAAGGDDGSANCVDGESAESPPIPELAVSFPASSPYVTAVGGTNLTLNPANAIVTQPVWNDDAASPGSAGGGGVSKLFTRPSYQDGVVSSVDRAIPDVAMLADVAPGFDVYCSAVPDCVSPQYPSAWQAVGGTSAATPLLAGGLALIDQDLRQHQQQSLGLVNPLLYSLGKNPVANPLVFSDVTVGSNDVGPFIGNDVPLGCCTAAVGFDDASGWGSVNLGNLANAALAAVPAIVDVSQTVAPHQQPAARKVIYDRVTCTGKCLVAALAHISIGHAKAVTERSGVYHLAQAGTKILAIPLPSAEVTELKAGIVRHLKITATVVGAIVDAAGNVERSTPATTLTITR
jgi:kumamolisin